MSLLPHRGSCFHCGHDHGEGMGSPHELMLYARIADLERQLAAAPSRDAQQEQDACTGSTAQDVRADVRAQQIDSEYAGRLALLLECMLIDPNGSWNEAACLLDEYRSAWDKINPQPPTFMGEPMPPERRMRLMKMKEARATLSSTAQTEQEKKDD